MDINEQGRKQRNRLQNKLNTAKKDLANQLDAESQCPSYKIDRAINSVKYYSKQKEEAPILLQAKIKKLQDKLQEEHEEYMKYLNKSLEEATKRLEEEKSKKSTRVIVLEGRYNGLLEEYIKRGWETEKEKLERLETSGRNEKISETQWGGIPPPPCPIEKIKGQESFANLEKSKILEIDSIPYNFFEAEERELLRMREEARRNVSKQEEVVYRKPPVYSLPSQSSITPPSIPVSQPPAYSSTMLSSLPQAKKSIKKVILTQ